MPRTSQYPKKTSFSLRIDAASKAAFTAATETEDRPAAQEICDFMRADVEGREQRAFEAEARRHALPPALQPKADCASTRRS